MTLQVIATPRRDEDGLAWAELCVLQVEPKAARTRRREAEEAMHEAPKAQSSPTQTLSQNWQGLNWIDERNQEATKA